MKPSYSLCLAASLLLSACGKNQSQAPATPAPSAPTAAATPAPATNPPSAKPPPPNLSGGYLGGLANSQAVAVKTIDVASLNQAVQMFNVDEGRFPKNLQELVDHQLISRIPKAPYGMQIIYDPATGQVKIVPQ